MDLEETTRVKAAKAWRLPAGPFFYERQSRQPRQSKAPFLPTLCFIIDAITSFSLKPLRIFLLMGFVMVGASVVYQILSVTGSPPWGVTTLIVLSFLGIRVNSIGIGELSEYLGRTHSEVEHRPLYVV